MRLQRSILSSGIHYNILPQQNRADRVVAYRSNIPLSLQLREESEYYFSEFLFVAFEAKAKLLWLDLNLVHHLRKRSSVTREEYSDNTAFMIEDSFLGWRYRLFRGTPPGEKRYNVEYLVLYLIQGSDQASLLEAHFESEKTPTTTIVFVPLYLINKMTFEEPY